MKLLFKDCPDLKEWHDRNRGGRRGRTGIVVKDGKGLWLYGEEVAEEDMWDLSWDLSVAPSLKDFLKGSYPEVFI